MGVTHLPPWHVGMLWLLSSCYYLFCGSITDAYMLAAIIVYKRWNMEGMPVPFLPRQYDKVWVLSSVAIGFVVLHLVWYRIRSDAQKTPGQLSSPLKPLLFPCQTTHTRLFPKKHSFKYSYLMVGVPVEWQGVAGDMIATGQADVIRKGWYQIHAADYLERGGGHLSLRQKLDSYLTSQGVDASQYPYAYLVTAAKFMGYHFNPVSFWYLYSAERDMTAMILEVNNTFDERRMYFLSSSNTENSIKDESDAAFGNDSAHQSTKRPSSRMHHAWPKDFHVSPFNSRKGGYSLVSLDPFAPMLEGNGSIDSTITLSSSKSQTKLVARIFSEGDAIDPEIMSAWNKFKFLASWWWVGFVTFPRIVREAGKLFFKRSLHVWFRPEPLKESMGRRAGETERQLELIFRRYLEHLVSQSPTELVLKYVPSGVADVSTTIFRSPSVEESSDCGNILELKVLTPVFYTRFACYAHDSEAFFCELTDNCTIWVSRPDLLPKLVFKKPLPLLKIRDPFDYVYFRMIQMLRKRPDRIERPLTSSQASNKVKATHTTTDIREFRLSSMDGFVLGHEYSKDRKLYRSLLLKLFLADRIALGSLELFWLEQFLLKAVLAWYSIP